MYVSVAVECSSSGTPIQLPLVHALGPKPANPINARFHARLETCTCFGFSIPCLRDIANFQTVLSPYKRDAKRHIERFHVSSSIVLQEALHLTTTPVFSSNDSSSTPHSPSACYTSTATAPTSPLLPTGRPFPLLLDLRETFFCRPPSHVAFFRRLEHRPFWTTSTQFDLRETSVTNFTIFLAVYFC